MLHIFLGGIPLFSGPSLSFNIFSNAGWNNSIITMKSYMTKISEKELYELKTSCEHWKFAAVGQTKREQAIHPEIELVKSSVKALHRAIKNMSPKGRVSLFKELMAGYCPFCGDMHPHELTGCSRHP